MAHALDNHLAPVFAGLLSSETSVAFQTDDMAGHIENKAELPFVFTTASAGHITDRQMVVRVFAFLRAL